MRHWKSGPVFHTFEARGLPYVHQRSMLPMEFAEVASTSMHLCSCGLCSKEEARRLRLQHLEETLLSLPMIIRSDAFQHRVYENPEQAQDPEAVGRKWVELGRRLEPASDCSAWEVENSDGWQNGNSTLLNTPLPLLGHSRSGATICAIRKARSTSTLRPSRWVRRALCPHSPQPQAHSSPSTRRRYKRSCSS